MKRTLTAWGWSLEVVARSYRTIVVLAALMALYAVAAYEWLGMPAESSALLMIILFIWAVVQLLAAAVIVGGAVAGAVEVAASGARFFRFRSLWAAGRKQLLPTLILCVVSLPLLWVCGEIFAWINIHALEVASFLTFHSGKPLSHVSLENIYNVIEAILWVVIGGFLLSFYIAYLRVGWREARRQTGKFLAGCAFRAPFLSSLVSVVAFGGIASKLANWHPVAPPGFWDYTQIVLRFAVVLILVSAGVLFFSLSLARLQMPKPEHSEG